MSPSGWTRAAQRSVTVVSPLSSGNSMRAGSDFSPDPNCAGVRCWARAAGARMTASMTRTALLHMDCIHLLSDRGHLGKTAPGAISSTAGCASREGEIEVGPDGHDAGGVEGAVAAVVMPLDVSEVHGGGNARLVVELAGEPPQVGIVDDAPPVALEVQVVHGVEADERREEPPVGLGDRVARQPAAPCEPLLEPVERLEQRHDGLLVRLLRGGEAGAVHAVVHGLVDARVERIDL